MSLEVAASAPPTPLDVAAFLPYASRQLQAPFAVRVVTCLQEEYVSAGDPPSKRDARSARSQPAPVPSAERDSSSSDRRPALEEVAHEVLVTAVLDAGGRLVELKFARSEVPRLLLKIIALCVPFHPGLTRLEARRCEVAGDALHEIAALLPLVALTDVCLDDSPVPEMNYAPLLQRDTLRRLSLARCELGDDACVELAALLVHPRPAALGLRAISLASNGIGDAGARAFGAALRSNRTLRHLDLADNRIGDEGAIALLRPLGDFPVTAEELCGGRRRLVEFTERRRETTARILEEMRTAPASEERGRRRAATMARSRPLSTIASDTPSARAAAMASELLGEYSDPFSAEELEVRESGVYARGNSVLCSLNISYNGVGYAGAAALRAVLARQAARAGLLRVVLDGNPLPIDCADCVAAAAMLEKALAARAPKKLERPKSKGK